MVASEGAGPAVQVEAARSGVAAPVSRGRPEVTEGSGGSLGVRQVWGERGLGRA